MDPIEINLMGRVWSNKLFARLVWQVLFNYYRTNGGDLNEMDSLLCDLYILQDAFSTDTPPNEEPRELGFHLEFDFGGSITDLKPSLPCPMLVIDWVVEYVESEWSSSSMIINKVTIVDAGGLSKEAEEFHRQGDLMTKPDKCPWADDDRT